MTSTVLGAPQLLAANAYTASSPPHHLQGSCLGAGDGSSCWCVMRTIPSPRKLVLGGKMFVLVVLRHTFRFPSFAHGSFSAPCVSPGPVRRRRGFDVPSQEAVFQHGIPVRRRPARLRAPGAACGALIPGARRSRGAPRSSPTATPRTTFSSPQGTALPAARPRPGGAGARRSPGPGRLQGRCRRPRAGSAPLPPPPPQGAFPRAPQVPGGARRARPLRSALRPPRLRRPPG